MTEVSPDIFTPFPNSHVEVSRYFAPQAVMDLRKEFVRKKLWLGPNHRDDKDRYDGTLATLHLWVQDDDDSPLASMRLTKIDTIGDSLSVEMLRSNPAMSQEASQFLMNEPTQAWDLTRLVTNEKQQKQRETVEALLGMIGAGIANTRTGESAKLKWIFIVEEPLKQLLDALGIISDVITQGKISHNDELDSVLCIADVEQLLRNVQGDDAFAFTREHVERGLAQHSNNRV